MKRLLMAGALAAAVAVPTAAATRHPPARTRAPAAVPGTLADPAPTVGQLCTPGYTASVRPPVTYTEELKRRRIAAWRLPGHLYDYEEDHLVPLELGGAPRDPNNLWPEPWKDPGGARTKDREENRLHRAVCAGTMPLADAQRQIVRDWGPK